MLENEDEDGEVMDEVDDPNNSNQEGLRPLRESCGCSKHHENDGCYPNREGAAFRAIEDVQVDLIKRLHH